MIVKDVEDGLSNFPENLDIYFECDGKQMFLSALSQMGTPDLVGPSRVPECVIMRFTDGTIQGQE
jgi:hypothetical protein